MPNLKTKRPRIKQELPFHTETINQRLSKVYRELAIETEYTNKQVKPVLTPDQRMDRIKQDYAITFGGAIYGE